MSSSYYFTVLNSERCKVSQDFKNNKNLKPVMFGWNVYFLINLWILLTERLISTCVIVSDDVFGFLFAFFFFNFENLPPNKQPQVHEDTENITYS